jgi:hypothetical protein
VSDEGAGERRSWVLPPASGQFEDLDLALLDLESEDDRAVLISAEHPRLAQAIREGMDELTIDGSPMNPRLHLTLHEIVTNQIWHDDPPETWLTAKRLIAAGYERHDILHMLASVLSGQIWSTLRDGTPHDPAAYARDLAALPGSWEQLGRERPARSKAKRRPARRRRRR